MISPSFNPLPDDKILDWSKLKQFADDNFEFDVHSRKFSELVENTVGKGEIARYEQFLLFPLCFQKACFPRASKCVIVWEWVKGNGSILRNRYMYYALRRRIHPSFSSASGPNICTSKRLCVYAFHKPSLLPDLTHSQTIKI